MTLPVELQEVLMQLLVAVVGLVVGVIGYYGRMYIKKLEARATVELGRDQWYWLKGFVTDAVESVMQNPVMKDWTKEQLREYVEAYAVKQIEAHNLPFDEDDVEVLIEQAVYWLKKDYTEQ
jgi:hypothetical protein